MKTKGGKFFPVFLFLLFFPATIFAADVEIIEVQTEGAGGSYDECVKIKNNGSETFSLSGLILQSKSASETAKWQSRSGAGLPEYLNINTGETVVLGSDKYTGGDAIWKHSSRWGLSADGGGMRLVEKDDDGNIVSVFAEKYWTKSETQTEQSEPPSPPQQSGNETIEQSPNDETVEQSAVEQLNNEIPELFSPLTPPPANAEENPAPINIQISEFMPNPSGSDDGEWIEIKNLSDKIADISGWFLDDEDGGSKPYQFPKNTIVPSNGFLIFYKIQTKLALNNDIDSVRLLKPDGEIAEQIGYNEGIEGASYARGTDGWFWTTAPTPSSENLIKKIEAEKPKETNSANKTASGNISITGIVSVKPGILGSQIFYINTPENKDRAGIQAYMYSKNFPELNVGDNVKIFGIISEAGGEKRIKISAQKDIIVLSNGDAPEPREINGKDINENLEGALVKISGEIVETKSSEFYVACDDGGEVKVYLKESSGLSIENYKAGERAEITGIVSQTATGYRLLPRSENDIIIKEATPSKTENNSAKKNPNTKYYIVLGAGLCSALGMQGWKRREMIKTQFKKIINKII